MDIKDLESFRLKDAISFHDELNPDLWVDGKLDPEVRKQVEIIANDFVSYLGIKDIDVKDVTISGSNAAYSYTDFSDLDIHILVDMSKYPNDDVYKELFDAKKILYSISHPILVRGIPVELYVQDMNDPVNSLGEYSVIRNNWIKRPTKGKANLDQTATKAKYESLLHLVQLALKSHDPDRIKRVMTILRRYRQIGLEQTGEYSPENLAFKALRNQGYLKQLRDLKNKLHGEKLSIDEENTFLDKPTLSVEELAKKHKVATSHIIQQLKIGIKVESEHTNHPDVAREIALDHLGEDPNYYTKLSKANLEEASGYIPSEKEKNDPRFKTALTKDVGPNAIKKNAKAFGFTTSRAGIPPQAKANGKV